MPVLDWRLGWLSQSVAGRAAHSGEKTMAVEPDNSNSRHHLGRMRRRRKIISRSEEMISRSIGLWPALTTVDIFQEFQNKFISIYNWTLSLINTCEKVISSDRNFRWLRRGRNPFKDPIRSRRSGYQQNSRRALCWQRFLPSRMISSNRFAMIELRLSHLVKCESCSKWWSPSTNPRKPNKTFRSANEALQLRWPNRHSELKWK